MDDFNNQEFEAIETEVPETEDTTKVSEDDIETNAIEATDEDSAPEVEQEEKKKPFFINKPIIIAAAVFLAAVVVFAVFFIVTKTDWFKNSFDKSIVGTWTLKTTASEDELIKENDLLRSYVVFKDEKNADGDNIVEIVRGNTTQRGAWAYVDAESKKSEEKTDNVRLTFIYQSFEGISTTDDYYSYSVDNGANERVLTLKNSNAASGAESENQFVSAEAVRSDISPDDKFKANDAVTGDWSFSTEDGISMNYTFNTDGTVSRTLKYNEYSDSFSGVYTITKDDKSSTKKEEKGTININYHSMYSGNTEELALSYIITKKTEGSSIVLNGLEYKKK